jgi:hypothetical protein
MPPVSLDPHQKHDPEFDKHLKALGLESAEAYQAWCAQYGFSIRIDKHWRERGKELYFFAQAAVQARRAQKKTERRRPRATLEAILEGRLGEADLSEPRFQLISRLLNTIEDEPTRGAFQELLISAEGRTNLLSSQPALPHNGPRNGNTFIEGLLSLARHRPDWIRPLDAWKERSRNPRRQFSSLARHLLAKYPLPAFLDSVWFREQTDQASKPQEWFKAIGAGKSVRELDFPIPFTRRMAHCFLAAPADYSVEAALRWGQVFGMGGDARLAPAILGSRIGVSFDHNDFWVTVIRWLIQNPLFDRAQVGPLIDYISRRKFEPVPIAGPGTTEPRPTDPGFTMKGRSAESLLRQMRAWHGELRKQPRRSVLTWDASGIGSFQCTEGVEGSNSFRRWTIVELLSGSELFEEGRSMRHCVASYDHTCAMGGTSIWSLGVEGNTGRRRRVLTVEVASRSKTICQMRGKANRLPKESELVYMRRWAAQEGLSFERYL